jgi:hypothetical protein
MQTIRPSLSEDQLHRLTHGLYKIGSAFGRTVYVAKVESITVKSKKMLCSKFITDNHKTGQIKAFKCLGNNPYQPRTCCKGKVPALN